MIKAVDSPEQVKQVIDALELLDFDYTITRSRMSEREFNKLIDVDSIGTTDHDPLKVVWQIGVLSDK